MSYVQITDRYQTQALPAVLDDYVPKDSPARFLDAFVDSLDMDSMNFKYARFASTGRPPYNPKAMLKLYLHGYINGTRSSRKLEALTKSDMVVKWLLCNLQPNFKTIADFRKDNIDALKKVTKTFIVLCRHMDLYGGDLIAVDGSKFAAQNHTSKSWTRKKAQLELEKINAKIAEYYTNLETSDVWERKSSSKSKESMDEKIVRLEESKEHIEWLVADLENRGENQISLTDPDCRKMKETTGRTDMSYNVQIAVDSKNKLIVAYDVINDGNDLHALSDIALQAKENLAGAEFTCLADAGYEDREEIKKCDDANIDVVLPLSKTSKNAKAGLFTKDDFRFDPEQDCYKCPAGEMLTFKSREKNRNVFERIYWTKACPSCPLKIKCTTSDSRRIRRWEQEEIIDKLKQRVKDNPKLTRKRGEIVEHVFGTFKRAMGQQYFLMKGFKKVRGEMSLSVLSLLMKRVLNILDVREAIEGLLRFS